MNARGFVMMEILVALLVVAVAVTAALALALDGLRSTTEARRAQVAGALAADIAGRVRALPGVAWHALPPPAGCVAACTPEQLAAEELAQWQSAAGGLLPDGIGLLEPADDGELVARVAWTDTGGSRRELLLGIGQ